MIKRKILKRLIVVVLCITLCIESSAYAAEGNRKVMAEDDVKSVELSLTKSEQKTIISEQEAIVEQLENVDFMNANEQEIDHNMEKILEEKYETLPELIQEAREAEEIDKKEEIYVEDNMPVKTYEISEGVEVTFDGSLTTVDIMKESGERECDDDLVEEENIVSKILNFGILQVKAAGNSKIKTVSNTKHIYETVHYKKDKEKPRTLKIATAHIEAEFTYNSTAKKCTAVITANYLKVNGLANLTASVESRKSGVQKPSKSRRIAYQEGYIKYGITIKGYGIVVGTDYIRVNVICDSKGNISKSHTLAHK